MLAGIQLTEEQLAARQDEIKREVEKTEEQRKQEAKVNTQQCKF